MPSVSCERVGLILRSGEVIELVNISNTPNKAFAVAPEDMIKYEGSATATWHTHPESSSDLSGEDYIGFTMWPDFLHLIFGTEGVQGYLVVNGAILKDARKDHPAWSSAPLVADRLRM